MIELFGGPLDGEEIDIDLPAYGDVLRIIVPNWAADRLAAYLVRSKIHAEYIGVIAGVTNQKESE